MTTVDSILDSGQVSTRQRVVMAACVAVLIFDGLDLQLLAFAAPVVTAEWGITAAEFGIVLAAALVGMAVGTTIGGLCGDRWGRRTVLLGSVVVFSIATLAIAVSPNTVVLGVLRLISGIAFGAAIPNAFVLSAEVLPRRTRARSAGLLAIGTPAGGVIGAALAIVLLPAAGWRVAFAVCGFLGLVLAVWLRLLVPESPSHLLARGEPERAVRVLHSLVPGLRLDEPLSRPAEEVRTSRRSGVGRWLAPPYRRTTVGAWIAFFAVSFSTFAINSWLPTVLHGAGLPLTNSIGASLTFNMCAVAGAAVLGTLVARMGSRTSLTSAVVFTIAVVIAVPALVGVARSGSFGGPSLLLVVLGLAGLGLAVANAGMFAVTSGAYPADMRSGGLGIALMFGRLAAVTTTIAGGVVLTATGNNLTSFFGMIIVGLLVTALGIHLVDRHIPATRASAPPEHLSDEAATAG